MARRLLARNLVAIGAAMIFASIAGAIEVVQANGVYQGSGPTGPLYAIDAAAQDLALRAREPTSFVQRPGPAQQSIAADPRDVITIVAIDDPTIAELGAYDGGYPRSQHAAVVEQLLHAPPRVIAFDVGFFEPTADDEVLGAALDHARSIGTRVVLADVGLVTTGQIAQTGDGELQFGSGLEPVSPLATYAQVGLANVLPDTRGTIRSMPLVALVGNDERPTLGLAALAAYLRRPRPFDARPQSGTLQVAGREVPVDATDSLLINYFGPPGQTFPVLSFVDVLRGRADPSTWRDRIVFVGALGATGLAEDYWTPVSDQGRKMAGVEIHANVAATLFSTQFLRVAPIADRIALGFVLALGVGLIAANLPVLIAAATTAGVLAVYVFAAIGLLVGFGWQLPLADPLLAGLGTFIASLAYRVASEQRQARGLEAALAAVVPPHVATFIAQQPERISLESQRRELTVLFGDLGDSLHFLSASIPNASRRP